MVSLRPEPGPGRDDQDQRSTTHVAGSAVALMMKALGQVSAKRSGFAPATDEPSAASQGGDTEESVGRGFRHNLDVEGITLDVKLTSVTSHEIRALKV
jgi:hypothetical protein